ncbi:MAG TPA: BON domain-containing protein [Candidatus Binataceae bacterium]|nr:BON domain-containing protein [Candidatus Binataceae bacterium]
MKKCPSCDKTYPDTETFCETDGTALVNASPAFIESGRQGALEQGIECPICGGKAEPGEVICNFCGARLTHDAPVAPPRTAPPPSSRPSPTSGQARTAISTAPPAQSSRRLTGQMPEQGSDEGSGAGGSPFSAIGYILAALIALVGGAWLALHLSSRPGAKEGALASPSAAVSPAPAVPAGPLVALANSISIQVTGESASAPERNSDAMRKVFNDGSGTLLDAYRRALAGDSTISDGMIVSLKVMPDGSVGGAAVRTSTAPNPGLDAEVVKDLSGWSFLPFGGGQVQADFPVIFAHDTTEQATIESALSTRLSSLAPDEAPEYGASFAATATPVVTPVPVESPTPAAVMTPAPAPVRTPRPHRRPPTPKPTPSMRDRVSMALRSNRKLGRVQFYTNPDGSVVLFGTVFDDKDKLLAERTVRSVPGVTSVADNLGTDMAIWATQQAQVQAQLATAGLDKVTVKIIGKEAFLSGEVKTDAEKDRAVTITENAAPVHVSGNIITVKPGSVFGF